MVPNIGVAHYTAAYEIKQCGMNHIKRCLQCPQFLVSINRHFEKLNSLGSISTHGIRICFRYLTRNRFRTEIVRESSKVPDHLELGNYRLIPPEQLKIQMENKKDEIIDTDYLEFLKRY